MPNAHHRRVGWLLIACGALLISRAAAAQEASDALSRIRARGTLVVGTDATYPPFELKIGDRFEGFDIDLGNEIGRELGVAVRWENIAWDGIFAALLTGKFDLVISDVVITEKRKRELAFSRPYFLSGQTIARRRGDLRVAGPDDLRGRIVGVQQETTGQYAVERLGLPASSIRKFDTMQDALLEVRNGRADAAVGDLPALREMIRKGYPELELTGGIFVQEIYGIVARPGDRTLLAAVNAALARIMADGRYAAMYERWMREPLPQNALAELDSVRGEGTLADPEGAGTARGTSESASPRSALTIRWDVLLGSLPLLLQGALLTLQVTAVTLVVGIPLGLAIALARLSRFRAVAAVALVYVEVVRGTPLLMQIFVIYFVLPSAGVALPQFAAAVCALGLNAAAYCAEIFRAGILSIDTGQMEAARSLGMEYPAAMRWVILPQTFPRVLPPLTNEAVALLKDTSLISIIGLAELMRVGREQVANTGAPVTIVTAMALLYLAMTLPLTALARRLERRLAGPAGPGTGA